MLFLLLLLLLLRLGVCLTVVPICREEKKNLIGGENEKRKERHDVLHSCSSILLTTPTAEIHIQRHQPTLFFPFSSLSLDQTNISSFSLVRRSFSSLRRETD